MTTEEKLKAIIQAQVKGGHKTWEEILKKKFDDPSDNYAYSFEDDGSLGFMYYDMTHRWHILEILLDPQGLKAAYEAFTVEDDVKLNRYSARIFMMGFNPYWKLIGHIVFNEWLNSNGDLQKTIQAAYDLLPSSPNETL